ncbi:MAG: hypothetical protein HDR11_16795 [Lachnospiraceae bacterium]|nr:hypothetical protein [Lachnospiraceae bacterium]MBD5499377.1 hypothetical protein [Lachnospiraceae bacterium]MBD5511250.1 hypothetical protein [Lachnospiraceae bacterium]MBD5537364.1 hypothetical protein [Lachnospiraceae bacterium]MDE6063377.1 hypothetical protein [Lachnospiraceae bacterium]
MPAKKTAAKEAATEVKVTPVKAEKAVTEEKAAPAKAEEKAAPAKAEKVAKTTKTTKTAKAAPAKRGRKPGSKTELKVSMNVQFGGKSYTTDDLVKIAKDVWKYDLKQKAADFKSVELYVKPEDGMAYYVINGKEAGSFYI